MASLGQNELMEKGLSCEYFIMSATWEVLAVDHKFSCEPWMSVTYITVWDISENWPQVMKNIIFKIHFGCLMLYMDCVVVNLKYSCIIRFESMHLVIDPVAQSNACEIYSVKIPMFCILNSVMAMMYHIDGLVQERHNSITNALELHVPCTNSFWW